MNYVVYMSAANLAGKEVAKITLAHFTEALTAEWYIEECNRFPSAGIMELESALRKFYTGSITAAIKKEIAQ